MFLSVNWGRKSYQILSHFASIYSGFFIFLKLITLLFRKKVICGKIKKIMEQLLKNPAGHQNVPFQGHKSILILSFDLGLFLFCYRILVRFSFVTWSWFVSNSTFYDHSKIHKSYTFVGSMEVLFVFHIETNITTALILVLSAVVDSIMRMQT